MTEKARMFEHWVCKEEPNVGLIVPAGTAIPVELGKRDWTLAGPITPAPDVEREVRSRGYHFFTIDEPERG